MKFRAELFDNARLPPLIALGRAQASPLEWLDTAGCWVKNDGLIAAEYGGNKVRKLERLLGRAVALGVRRIFTVGAAGSHHVLACALFAARVGLRCGAALFPQPFSEHARSTLLGIVGSGAELVPTANLTQALRCAWKQRATDTMVIGPGGMGRLSALAYAEAIDELQAQLRQQGAAPPGTIVVAAGSGGTAAGLLAGIVRHDWPTILEAVQVAPNPALRALVLAQAWSVLRTPLEFARAAQRLRINPHHLGGGYGVPARNWPKVAAVACSTGLTLDPTYTGKAFSCVLDQAAARQGVSPTRSLLYWHTLSAVATPPGLIAAPEVPRFLSGLLTSAAPQPPCSTPNN